MTPLNKLPSSWRLSSLGELSLSSQYGLNEKTTHDASGILCLRITDITEDGQLNITDPRYISTSTPRTSNYLLEPGDVVIARSGSVGLGYVELGFEQPLVYASYLIRFRLDQRLVEPEYIKFFLRSPFYWHYIDRVARGVTILNINSKQLARLPIPLPTLPEQREIVKILRQADHLRHLRVEANQLIGKLPNTLFLDLFLRDSERLNAWEKIKLGNIATTITSGPRGWGKYYADEGARFIRVQDVQHGEIVADDPAFVTPPNSSDKDRARITPNDLLITITGTIGRVAVAPAELPESYVSQHVAIVRLDNTLSPDYVAAYLNHPFGGQITIQKMNYGQTKPGLNLSQIQSLRIPKPPTDLINKFEISLKNAQDVQDNSKRLTSYQETMRTSLLIRAFTGELTQNYRDQNLTELTRSSAERDFALSHPSLVEQVDETEQISTRSIVEFSLSPAQRNLLTFIEDQDTYITDDNLDIEIDLSPNEVRRNLDLLAKLGLVRVAQIAVTPGELGQIFFTKIYRALHLEDNIRQTDLAILSETQSQ